MTTEQYEKFLSNCHANICKDLWLMKQTLYKHNVVACICISLSGTAFVLSLVTFGLVFFGQFARENQKTRNEITTPRIATPIESVERMFAPTAILFASRAMASDCSLAFRMTST